MRFLILIFQFYSGFNVVFSEDQSRIVNGVDAFIQDYPYMVSVQLGGGHMCGGAILNDDTILTAAHCMIYAKYFPLRYFLKIEAGATKVYSGEQTITVNGIYVHPKFVSKTFDYDIAVLKLKRRLQFDDKVQPIGIAVNQAPAGSNATVAGWGLLERGGRLSSRLKVLYVPVIDLDTCKKLFLKGDITERMLCAGYIEGGKDACKGDSGGPLVFNNQVIGIVSWGYGCARKGYPGVFTDVTKFINYVQKYQ